jgi:signal transduction histidine kinase
VRLTLRRRALLAVLAGWPLGFAYINVAAHQIDNVARDYRGVSTVCDRGLLLKLDAFNGCETVSFHPGYVWLELTVITVVAAAVCYGLARWVSWPVRQVADTVTRFGPNSLGLRLRADGPHDETRQLSDAVDAMLDRLAEGYEAQRRFASSASHELRTPLATQRALIEVSLSSALTPEQLDLLSRQLLATNERNERLVDGLLTLAETDRGLLTNTPQRLDEITAEAVASLATAVRDREITVSTSFEPATVNGERPLLERLASNLVFNAIRHNHPGGSVEVAVTGDGTLTVTNTGPVVPPEHVNGLFEPFRRGSGERLDHGGGVGLGLTIARSIVAAHGAEIRATANPTGGLCVEVRFRPVG